MLEGSSDAMLLHCFVAPLLRCSVASLLRCFVYARIRFLVSRRREGRYASTMFPHFIYEMHT